MKALIMILIAASAALSPAARAEERVWMLEIFNPTTHFELAIGVYSTEANCVQVAKTFKKDAKSLGCFPVTVNERRSTLRDQIRQHGEAVGTVIGP